MRYGQYVMRNAECGMRNYAGILNGISKELETF